MTIVRNTDIRQEIKQSKLKHWIVAEELNLNEASFCRKLRKELPENEKTKIREAIKRLLKKEA